MRILLVASAFNSLTQRVHTELRERHHIGVELALGDDLLRARVESFRPDLILAPMLTTAIPEDVWTRYPVLIVHPGPMGDRGPSSLDWAIHEGATEWGVTVLQAVAEMDAGPIWASVGFPVAECGKSELYRNEAADAAVRAVLLAVERFAGDHEPEPLDYTRPDVRGQLRPYHSQQFRRIDWSTESTAAILRKLRAADSQPGVVDVLAAELDDIPEAPVTPAEAAKRDTWSELRYRQEAGVGYLEFAFAGGAMDTRQCRRLLDAYRQAARRPVDVLVLGPARDFFSNGIHLNVIEAAADPAQESWRNITAMDDLVEAILTTTDKLVISALTGNAAAGGVMLALAADEVWCRESVVLNPHYRLMGLYGSEYWTYSLPRRVGAAEAARLTSTPLPVGAREAVALGLADYAVPGTADDFWTWARQEATALAAAPELAERLLAKKHRRASDEAVKPLAAYREEELTQMHRNFFSPNETYHELRQNFVYSVSPMVTPAYLLG